MRETAVIVLRSVCAYALLLLFGRLIGRKMISRITFFDFLVGVTLGSLAVRIALGAQNSLLLSVIATSVITLLVLVTDRLNLLSLSVRAILDGNPVVVVQKGALLEKNMKRARISINKLFMLLHEKDIFDLSDVQEAVYESNGQLSVLLAPAKQPVTKADIGKVSPPAKMPVDLIVDGRLLKENLSEAGIDLQWLLDQLKMRKLSPSAIFYAGLDTNGALYLSPKRK